MLYLFIGFTFLLYDINIRFYTVLNIRRGNRDILRIIINIPPSKLSYEPALESARRNGSNERSQQMFG